MKLAIMQPYFMPYIGYFQAIKAVDKYILYSNLTFIKHGWMNRNRLQQPNGQILNINVPLKHKSSNSMIYDVEVDNTQDWQKKLRRAIFFNYKSAVYFDETYPFLERLLSTNYDLLSDLNVETIKAITSYLDINTIVESDNTRFLEMERLLEVVEDDYSVFPYLKTRPTRMVARVLEMCRMEGCNEYVNAIGGQELYHKEEFKLNGIDLHFVQTHEFTYPQLAPGFEPNLSIIDVLMHNGKEGTKKLLNEYTLI